MENEPVTLYSVEKTFLRLPSAIRPISEAEVKPILLNLNWLEDDHNADEMQLVQFPFNNHLFAIRLLLWKVSQFSMLDSIANK